MKKPDPPKCKHLDRKVIGRRNADGSPIEFCNACKKIIPKKD